MLHEILSPAMMAAKVFNSRVEDVLQHWRVPGLALAVVDRHTVTAQGYGVARVGDNAPVTPETLFVSMSKSFTAASVALLVQNDDEEMKDVVHLGCQGARVRVLVCA
jgi:CubicO group peptidase (beta-lactamase class C family)